MDFDKSLSVPFYEYLCTIIPCTKLQATKSKLNPNKQHFKGYHELVFYMIDECNLSISRTESFEEMDKRVIINFYKCNEFDGTLVNEIPPHLKIRVNQYQIPLSEYLPYDNCRNTGRRFPRSIDITDPVFLSKTRENQCIINWDDQDHNNGKYYFMLNLVRMRSTEELCTELMNNSTYPFENTQAKFLKTVSNENTSLITSLICPISLIRINTPVRGDHCNHLQCFDLVTYLTINFQKPNWQCPICDKKTAYTNLKIDNLIFGIINDKKSGSMREIIFNVQGQWKSSQKSKSVYNDVPKSIKRKANDEENSETAAKKFCHVISNELDSPNSRPESTLSNLLYEDIDSQPQIVVYNPFIQKTSTPLILNDKSNSSINPYSMVFDPISKISTSVVESPLNCHQDTFIKEKDQISTLWKSVTSQSSSDDSDSIIEIENFRRMPHTKIEYKTIKKESTYYSEYENYISRENRSMIVFEKPEDIPNNLKGDTTEKRKLVILKMGQNTKIKISSFNPKSGDIEIHAASKPLDIYIGLDKENVNYLITLEAFSSINFICHEEWRDRITLSFIDLEKSVAAFEIFENEENNSITNPNEYHEAYFDIIETICVENKSFLNRTLNLNEIRRKIRFLDVKSSVGKYCLRHLPIAVVVLDYDGNEMFHEIITPRGMVKAYRQDIHGLSESNIIGNVDEEECTKALRTLLYDTVVVGIQVSAALFSLRIPIENVLGIRELSTALCFDKLQVCSAFRSFWTLKCLAKKVIGKQIQVEIGQQYMCKENVNAVRDIYLSVENQWVDHIHPDGTQELNLDYSSLEQISMKNKTITDTEHIDSSVSETSDNNDLGDAPDIELMEEEDIGLSEEDLENMSDYSINDEEGNDVSSINNHLSGDISQFTENYCNKTTIEDYQDKSINLIDNAENTEAFICDDSVIQTNTDKTNEKCFTESTDSQLSIIHEDTVNEISSGNIECCDEFLKNINDDCIAPIDNVVRTHNDLMIIDTIDLSVIPIDNNEEKMDNDLSILDTIDISVIPIDNNIEKVDNDLSIIDTIDLSVIPIDNNRETMDYDLSILDAIDMSVISIDNNREKVDDDLSIIDTNDLSVIPIDNNREKVDDDLSIIDTNDSSIISIDFPTVSMENSSINKNYVNNNNTDNSIKSINCKETNCFGTSEVVSEKISNESNLLNNENIINNSNLLIDLDEILDCFLSNNDESNKSDIKSIDIEDSANEISINEQDHVKYNDNNNSEETIVHKSINCHEISDNNNFSENCAYKNKTKNIIINHDTEEKVEIMSFNNEETELSIEQYLDDSGNNDNYVEKSRIVENGYLVVSEENSIKNSSNGKNINECQYLDFENDLQEDYADDGNDFLDVTNYVHHEENQTLSFTSDGEIDKIDTSNKSIPSKNLEISEDQTISSNFKSKLQTPDYTWTNLRIEMNIDKMKTIILNKDEMVTSVKMKNENGSVNYLVKGIFYCPTTETWTNLELDKESILELKKITKKIDKSKDMGSIDLTYDSN